MEHTTIGLAKRGQMNGQITITRLIKNSMTLKVSIEMRRYTQIIKVMLALLIVGGFFSTTFACEPSLAIKVVNKTDANLRIYFDDTFQGDAPPGKDLTFKEPAIFPIFIIVAKDATGNVVYTTNFTSSDIKGKKTYEVVIPASPAK